MILLGIRYAADLLENQEFQQCQLAARFQSLVDWLPTGGSARIGSPQRLKIVLLLKN
jgi:hypothetical protein